MINWDSIETFVGYGSARAPIVFIGVEEGVSQERNLGEELLRRSEFDSSIMDLRIAQERLGGSEYLNRNHPKTQRTWRVMCQIALQMRGCEPNYRKRLQYQLERLGAADGDELMMELLPYPHRSTRDWNASFYPRYANRPEYQAAMIPKRVEQIRRVLSAHPRRLILCYGKAYWEHFKKLFPAALWVQQEIPDVSIPNFMAVNMDGTSVLLLPHLGRQNFYSNCKLRAVSTLIESCVRRGSQSPDLIGD